MEGAMGQATTLSAPEDQVTALMQQVADENGLEISSAMPSALDTTVASAQKQQENELTRRFQRLSHILLDFVSVNIGNMGNSSLWDATDHCWNPPLPYTSIIWRASVSLTRFMAQLSKRCELSSSRPRNNSVF